MSACAQGPTGLHFRIGAYEWRHYRRGQTNGLRWECQRHGRGSAGRTPLGAFLALRRWMNVPLPLPDTTPEAQEEGT